MLCLPVKQLNGWLYGINANRVKESIRDKLLAFQEECHAAIYHHMHGSANQEVVEILKEMIKQQQIVIDRQEARLNSQQETIDTMSTTITDIQKQATIHNRMLGLEASVAGKRLAAARHLKIV